MKVQSTTEYGKFKIIEGNRKLNSTHLKNLSNSILKNNLLESNPIIVTQDFEVVDGQHRLEIAKENDLPIYYVVIEQADLSDVLLLQTQKLWNTDDFLESNIVRGKKEYELLRDFSKTYKISVAISLLLLTNSLQSGSGRSGKLRQQFKNGDLHITNLKRAIEIAQMIAEIRPYAEKTVIRSRDFITALIKSVEKVGFDKLLNKISVQKNKIQSRTSLRDYLLELEDIYNYRARKPVKFY